MIRNVVLHLLNEQPMMADLFDMPQPSDGQLVCTNLRTMNGKRPVFIDAIESVFVFPLGQLRFVEIPPAAGVGSDGRSIDASVAATTPVPSANDDGDGQRNGVAEAVAADADQDLDLDEDFLRRVREL